MPKKTQVDVPNPDSVTNKDIIQRLNFLYQASVYMNSIAGQSSASCSSSTHVAPVFRERGGKRSKTVTTGDLSRTYISSMKIVRQKATAKIDPAVKRTLCKGCNVVLAPGLTAIVRTKKSSSYGHTVTYSCTVCKTPRRIPAPPIINSVTDINLRSPESLSSFHKVSSESHSAAPNQVMDEGADDLNVISLQSSSAAKHSRRKRRATPRHPPLFARNAGHIVFCGHHQIMQEEID